MQSSTSPTPGAQAAGAVSIILAIAETIRELREVPAGHLYAPLMGRMTHEQFEKVLSILTGAGMIERTPAHLLIWKGPTV